MNEATSAQLSTDAWPLPRKKDRFGPRRSSVGGAASTVAYVERYHAPATLCWLITTGITPLIVTPSAKATGRVLILKFRKPGQSKTRKPAESKNDGKRIIVANPKDRPPSKANNNARPLRLPVANRNASRLNTHVNTIGTSTAFIEKLSAPSRASTISPRLSANTTRPIETHARFHAAIANITAPATINTKTTMRFNR